LTIATLLCASSGAGAQVTFQHIIGPADADSARWVDRTTDGGYVIAGMSSADGNQAYVVKVDPLGAVLWDSLFGATGIQRAHRVLQTPDGGYVVAGETSTTDDPPLGVLLAKLDSCGNVLWVNLFSGTPFVGETSLDLVSDVLGDGFILGSRLAGPMGVEQGATLIRTDAGGNLLWGKFYFDTTYGLDTYASFTDVHAIPGGFIAVGSLADGVGGTTEVFLLKTDTSGVPLAGWPITYGDVDLALHAAGLETAANGDYLLACGFKGGAGGNGTYLIRTDSAGAVIWCKTFAQFDPTDSIEETPSGDIVLAGKVPGSNAGMLLTNASGVFQWCWDYTYGGTSPTVGEAVVPTNDGGYLLAASTQILPTDFDYYPIKTDGAGSSGCNELPFSPDLADRTPDVGTTVFPRLEPIVWASMLYTETPADSLETILCLSGDPCVEPVCPCPLGMITQGGMNDGFMPPPDPATPSADLITWVIAHDYLNRPPMDFDEIPGLTVGLDGQPTGDNRYFAHTFAGLPESIVAASLEIRIQLTTVGPIGDTDTIALWLPGPSGPFAWARLIEDLNGGPGSWSVGGSVAILTLDLAALPLAAGGTQCILPEINSNQALDIMVQDDTGVDYIRLTILACSCAEPPGGMVAWWPLDELEDLGVNADGIDDVRDLTPNASHGDTVAGPTLLLGEMVDNSLCFDGSSQYVQVPNAPALNFGTGNFSIDAWIRTTSTTGVHKIVDKRVQAASTTGYSFFVSNGNLAFQIADGAGMPGCLPCPTTVSCTNYDSGVAVATGDWVHVAVTVERVTDGGTFYVNGAPVSIFNPDCHPGSVTNTSPLRIGSRSSTVTGLFDGCIDEVELFDRELTPGEVSSIFNAGAEGKCKPHCDCPGDVNGDGVIDGFDVMPFVRCLLGISIAGDNCACADINGDGVVNGLDIGPFIDLVINGVTCDCGPTLDETECKAVTCPDPAQECVPTCMNLFDDGTGVIIVTVQECDCLDPGECHVEYLQGGVPFCEGDCPPDETCVETVTDDGAGGWDTCCRCEATGACCLQTGQCIQTTADDCQDQGGVYLGDNVPCGGIEACCWNEPGIGMICQEVDQLCCQAIFGGTPQGAGTTCQPTGACCYDADGDGIPEACEVMAEVCCDDFGGTFQGAGTTCLGVGACCYGPTMGTCVEIDELCCDDIFGTFMGVGTNCLGDGNGNGIDDACEPGDLCPLVPPPLEEFCAALQLADCQLADPPTDETCLPKVVQVLPVPPGGISVTECGCFLPDDCGAIEIDSSTTWLSCPMITCPVPGEDCLIYLNGVATTSNSVDYSTLSTYTDVTCQCGP
jgi:hypothetical protein